MGRLFFCLPPFASSLDPERRVFEAGPGGPASSLLSTTGQAVVAQQRLPAVGVIGM
jgi:hypothetical protein